jgi:cytochrome c oxidase subunit 2
MRDRPVAIMVAAGVVASALGIVLGLSIDWFPTVASVQADKIKTLYDVLVIASVPIFVLVVTVVLGAVIRFRMRPGQEDQDGPPIHGNTRLEVIWTALPAIIILGLCVYAATVLHDAEKAPAADAQELKIGVTAEQFAWTYTYPKEVTGGTAFSTADLTLPIGRSVQFQIVSEDVIHDFWVPNFSMKIDAVPGITTRYRVTPNRLGTYPVVCAELCGLGHSVMRSAVHVVTPAAYALWLRKKNDANRVVRAGEAGASGGGTSTTAAAAGDATAGKQVYAANGCGGCHTLADAGTKGQIGPNLDTALKNATDADIKEDIVAPNKEIAKGYGPDIMPGNFGSTLSAADLANLVAYLKEATK